MAGLSQLGKLDNEALLDPLQTVAIKQKPAKSGLVNLT